MHPFPISGRSFWAGAIVFAAFGAGAGAAATHPAAAAAALSIVESTVSCGSSSACVTDSNTSTGPGLTGKSAKGTGITASGVSGITATGTTGVGVEGTSNSYPGLEGTSNSSDGVKAISNGYYGVSGTSTKSFGVFGKTTSGAAGVGGSSPDGYGLYGTTSNGDGVGAVGVVTGSGIGVYGGSNSSYGVEGQTSSGYALYGTASGSGSGAYLSAASGGYGLITYSKGNVALYAQNSNGNGGDVRGSYIGTVSRAPSTGFPIVATDPNGNNLFYVDGAGNVSYHGSLYHFARIGGGALVKSYSPNTTSPTVEDTGTAQLIGGVAAVRLDPTFAASIDTASAYRVFLTPNGDTRGLFVASKTLNGFVVRESQGGKSSVSFDYRIVASALGTTGQRMAVTAESNAPRAAAVSAPRSSAASLSPRP